MLKAGSETTLYGCGGGVVAATVVCRPWVNTGAAHVWLG